MFVTRLISGILLVLAAIFLFFTGGAPLVVVMGILSLIGMFELYRVLKMEKHPGCHSILCGIGIVLCSCLF